VRLDAADDADALADLEISREEHVPFDVGVGRDVAERPRKLLAAEIVRHVRMAHDLDRPGGRDLAAAVHHGRSPGGGLGARGGLSLPFLGVLREEEHHGKGQEDDDQRRHGGADDGDSASVGEKQLHEKPWCDHRQGPFGAPRSEPDALPDQQVHSHRASRARILISTS
jgi:hypothetical protein